MGDNVATAKRTYEAWNNRDFDAMAEVMANAVQVIAGSGDRLEGGEGARHFAELWANAFPDGRIEIDNVVDGGDQVVIEFTGRGTHDGTFAGPLGVIPPTGRSVTLKLCDVWRFEAGSAKTLTSYFDTGSLMTQLGLMPEAAAAQA